MARVKRPSERFAQNRIRQGRPYLLGAIASGALSVSSMFYGVVKGDVNFDLLPEAREGQARELASFDVNDHALLSGVLVVLFAGGAAGLAIPARGHYRRARDHREDKVVYIPRLQDEEEFHEIFDRHVENKVLTRTQADEILKLAIAKLYELHDELNRIAPLERTVGKQQEYLERSREIRETLHDLKRFVQDLPGSLEGQNLEEIPIYSPEALELRSYG